MADLGQMPVGWAAVGLWWKAGDIAHYWNGSTMECGTEHRGLGWFPRATVDDNATTVPNHAAERCPYCVATLKGGEVSTDGPWLERLGSARAARVVEAITNRRVGTEPVAELAALLAADVDPLYKLGRHRAGASGEWRPGRPAPRSLTDFDPDNDTDRYPAALCDLLEVVHGRTARAVLRGVLDQGHVALLNRRHQPLELVDAAGWVNAKALTRIGRPVLALAADGRIVLHDEVPADIVNARRAAEREAANEKNGRKTAAKATRKARRSLRASAKTARAPLVADEAPITPAQGTDAPPKVEPSPSKPGGRDPSDTRTIDLEERALARSTPLGRRVLDALDDLPSGRTVGTVLDDGRVVPERRPGVAVVVERGPGGARGWIGEAQGDGFTVDVLAARVVEQLEQRAVQGFEQPELLAELAPVRAVGLLRGGRVLDRSRPGGHKVLGLTWDLDEARPENPLWRPARHYTALRVEASRTDSGWIVAAVVPGGMYCTWMVQGIPLGRGLMRLRAWLAGVSGCGLPPPLSEAAMSAELRGAAFDPLRARVVEAVRRAVAPAVAGPRALPALPPPFKPVHDASTPMVIEGITDEPVVISQGVLLAQRLLDRHRPGWVLRCDIAGKTGRRRVHRASWYVRSGAGPRVRVWSHQGHTNGRPGALAQVFGHLREAAPGWGSAARQGPVIALGCDPRPLALPAPERKTQQRALPRQGLSRPARVHAALRRRGLQLARSRLPATPGAPAVVRWTVRDASGVPRSPSKVDPVAAAAFALSLGEPGETSDPIALQPPWVMRWDGALTHDAWPGPRGAFASITMARQIGAWLEAIALQFPRLRKLGAPGCSTGWATWGRWKPEALGGYIQIVYDPPTAHGNFEPARPKPPEGVVGPYVRLDDEVIEVPEPCPHLLAVAAARLAALALGGVDQRADRSGAGQSRTGASAEPETARTQAGRQPDDGQPAASPEPETSQPPSQGAASAEPEPSQGVELVQIAEPRASAGEKRVLVELCAGTAAVSLRALGGFKSLTGFMGAKAKDAPVLVEALGVRDPDEVHLVDVSSWGYVWKTLQDERLRREVVAVLYRWHAQGNLSEMWPKLLYPPPDDPAERVAQQLALQARAAGCIPVWFNEETGRWESPSGGRTGGTCRADKRVKGAAQRTSGPGGGRQVGKLYRSSPSRGLVRIATLAERVEALDALDWSRVHVHHMDVRDFAPIPGARVYGDPPYDGAPRYEGLLPRADVLAVAERHAAVAERMIVSEAEALPLDGWRSGRLRLEGKPEWVTYTGSAEACDEIARALPSPNGTLDLQPRSAPGRGQGAAPAAKRHAGAPSDAAARVLACWQDLAPKTGRRPKVEPEALLAIRARLIAEGQADDDAAVARAASTRYGKRVSRLAVVRAHATARERLDAIAAELGPDTVTAAIDALAWAPRWSA